MDSFQRLAWLIIASVTVAGTGTLAYFYYKLLNYFIRMKIEAEPDLEPLERETKLKRTFRVQEGELTYSAKLITVTWRSSLNFIRLLRVVIYSLSNV